MIKIPKITKIVISNKTPIQIIEVNGSAKPNILEKIYLKSFNAGLTASLDGETLFKDIRFSMNKEDKIVLLGSPNAKTALLDILMEQATPDAGTFKWGVTTSQSYFENDHDKYFLSADMLQLMLFLSK